MTEPDGHESTTEDTEPRWSAPYPYGYEAAIDSMGSISAPLLAAMSVTLSAVVITSPGSFPWLTATLLLLIGATFAFVGAVQCSFHARQYALTPDLLESWWPDRDEPGRRELLRRFQRHHRHEFEKWANVARWFYNAGIGSFALGLTALLAPNRPDHARFAHLAPAALAALAFVLELVWIAWSTRRREPKHWPDPLPEPGEQSSQRARGQSG
jgi:hypothetical protein